MMKVHAHHTNILIHMTLQQTFFYFYKQAHILKKAKKLQSIHGVYEATMAFQPKNKTTQPLIKANYSNNPIREFDSISMYTLVNTLQQTYYQTLK